MCEVIIYEFCRDACATLTPGLTTIKVALADWVLTMPEITDYDTDNTLTPATLDGDVIFDTATFPDAGWKEMCIDLKSGQFGYECLNNDGSKYYQSKIEAFVSTNERLAHHAFHKYKSGELIICAKDADGNTLILGNPDNPVESKHTFTSGKGANDKKGFNWELLWEVHSYPIYFYDGVI